MSYLTQKQQREIREVIRVATMERSSFSRIGFDGPFPTSEAEVNAFIRERTKIWRETWIIGPLEKLLRKAEAPAPPIGAGR